MSIKNIYKGKNGKESTDEIKQELFQIIDS